MGHVDPSGLSPRTIVTLVKKEKKRKIETVERGNGVDHT
jgi:hypothetical protein